MLKLDTQRIEEVLVGTKYEPRWSGDEHAQVRDAKLNAAKAILLERLCGELVGASGHLLMDMGLSGAKEEHAHFVAKLEKALAQARELGIGE